jgi:hypothetical protein
MKRIIFFLFSTIFVLSVYGKNVDYLKYPTQERIEIGYKIKKNEFQPFIPIKKTTNVVNNENKQEKEESSFKNFCNGVLYSLFFYFLLATFIPLFLIILGAIVWLIIIIQSSYKNKDGD